ncbi:TetR/AcrR family transcriptional regulator [Xanthomonas arboricola pv. juglandis]|uniref:TetR/AcrR family transcriptional regulator n=1 Tax=Xanthomonas arboricola TaxID=56448 RepID=UPI0003708030|nr:TetR/AcrR family transcriptional regulator [Xanthomonas arboricola]MDN0221561.1 TetR/AcrR family transcriptional regulator [Xanthomonas arboricola pv. juglandis]MDN0225835.1 TetR/AcrR family transcriptional regulator [Xanthomonas arboricola pv. juglandis]MDN0230017.1 TetR/AcrR family transcriptional regulator [Xanthomonas arboricola pv. juglandis]MDN0234317.1 TetR/AcrR family transcriptional regulator [Xanthomonas arboricola pv. juglandis]MDN0238614.1 TetR/AcrR family transcriptional regula
MTRRGADEVSITSPRARLSRQANQERTHEQLLASARSLIARRGLAGISVRDVAEGAGFSQGAFYSNFASKDALLMALMETEMQRLVEQFDRFVVPDTPDMASALRGIVTWLVEMHQDSTEGMMLLELQLHANRDPSFGEPYGRHKARFIDAFARVVERVFVGFGLVPSMPPRQIVIGFWALLSGFSLQRSTYAEHAESVYTAYINAIIASSGE